MTKTILISFSTLGISLINILYGNWNGTLNSLVILQIIDIITGFLAFTLIGHLDSKAFMKGCYKKIGVWLALVVCFQIDHTLNPTNYNLFIIGTSFFISSEILSLIENFAKIGINFDFLPQPIKDLLVNNLKQVKDYNNKIKK